MPAKTAKQAKYMRGCAMKAKGKKECPPKKVAREMMGKKRGK